MRLNRGLEEEEAEGAVGVGLHFVAGRVFHGRHVVGKGTTLPRNSIMRRTPMSFFGAHAEKEDKSSCR